LANLLKHTKEKKKRNMETLAAFNLLVDGMVLTSRIAVQNRLSDLQYFVLNMMVGQMKYFPKIPNNFHAEHPMQFPKRVFPVKHSVTSLVSTCIYLREEQK
jgi:hypothetical protein